MEDPDETDTANAGNEVLEIPTPDADEHQDDETQTYPAKVVKDLRKESASYRERAKVAETRADELAHALFTAKVESTGKLASVDDLPFDAALLDDPDALNAAIDDLVASHPHYAKRKIQGGVGQGERGANKTVPQDFSALFH